MSAKGMAPPPKHPLSLGDRRDATERRRAELEKWLWRLIGTPDIARSSQLKAFLEFDRALQRAQQHQQRKLEQQRYAEGYCVLMWHEGLCWLSSCASSGRRGIPATAECNDGLALSWMQITNPWPLHGG